MIPGELPARQMQDALRRSIEGDRQEINFLNRLKGDFQKDRANHGPHSEAERAEDRALRIVDDRITKEEQEVKDKLELISLIDRIEHLSSTERSMTRLETAESIGRSAGRATGKVLGGLGRRLSALESEDERISRVTTEAVAGLHTFRGYFPNYEKRQFQKFQYGKPPEIIPFDSSRGRQMLRDLERRQR